MAFQITITADAESQLQALPEFEPRVGDLLVLYNVEAEEVVLLLVGRKLGNKLIVEGEEFHGHQDNPAEQPGGEPGSDVE